MPLYIVGCVMAEPTTGIVIPLSWAVGASGGIPVAITIPQHRRSDPRVDRMCGQYQVWESQGLSLQDGIRPGLQNRIRHSPRHLAKAVTDRRYWCMSDVGDIHRRSRKIEHISRQVKPLTGCAGRVLGST